MLEGLGGLRRPVVRMYTIIYEMHIRWFTN